MRLLLIRHGETPSNLAGKLDTRQPGPGLTRHGMHQAERLATTLAGQGIQRIGCSPLTRTRLTAQPLAERLGLPVEVYAGVREISAGELEMRADPESVDAYRAVLAAWARGDTGPTIPGGEQGNDFLERFDRVVDTVTRGKDVVALFSHGAAIRAWTCSRDRASANRLGADSMPIANACVIKLVGSTSDGWRISRWPLVDPAGDRLLPDPTGAAVDDGIGDNPRLSCIGTPEPVFDPYRDGDHRAGDSERQQANDGAK